MAGIIEGPFRYIVQVPSFNPFLRGMQELMFPFSAGHQLIGEANAGPGPTPTGTYSYVDSISFDPGSSELSEVFTAAVLTASETPWGYQRGFRVLLEIGEWGSKIGRWVGQYVRVNGELRRPWHFSRTFVSGYWQLDFYLNGVQALETDEVTVQLILTTLPDNYSPKTSQIVIRVGDTPPFDYEAEKATVQSVLGSQPASPAWPVSDGAVVTSFSRTTESSENPRPEYFERLTYSVQPLEMTDPNIFWAVGRASVPTMGQVQFYFGVYRHDASGRVPWPYGTNVSGSPTSVLTAATVTLSRPAPLRVFIESTGSSPIMTLKAEFTGGDIEDIASIDVSELDGEYLADRKFLVQEALSSTSESYDYSIPGYWYTEKACLVRGLACYYP
jgi:hypothetical protein